MLSMLPMHGLPQRCQGALQGARRSSATRSFVQQHDWRAGLRSTQAHVPSHPLMSGPSPSPAQLARRQLLANLALAIASGPALGVASPLSPGSANAAVAVEEPITSPLLEEPPSPSTSDPEEWCPTRVTATGRIVASKY